MTDESKNQLSIQSRQGDIASIPIPSSCMLSFPKITAPASIHFWTHQLVMSLELVKSLDEPSDFL